MGSSPLLGAAAVVLIGGLRLYWIGKHVRGSDRFQALAGWSGSSIIPFALLLLPFAVLFALRLSPLSFPVRFALFAVAFAPAALAHYRARATEEDEPEEVAETLPPAVAAVLGREQPVATSAPVAARSGFYFTIKVWQLGLGLFALAALVAKLTLF
jgi:hypothetical protein